MTYASETKYDFILATDAHTVVQSQNQDALDSLQSIFIPIRLVVWLSFLRPEKPIGKSTVTKP